jgi:small subunit ribosomal protein S18
LVTRIQDSDSRGPMRHNKRVCAFCRDKAEVDYRNLDVLRGFLTPEGNMLPRRQTGNCAKHQRQLGKAVKLARHLALLPHAPQHTYEYR